MAIAQIDALQATAAITKEVLYGIYRSNEKDGVFSRTVGIEGIGAVVIGVAEGAGQISFSYNGNSVLRADYYGRAVEGTNQGEYNDLVKKVFEAVIR